MSNEEITLSIDNELAGLRLDLAIVELLPDYSRSWAQKAIKNKLVKVRDNIENSPKYKVNCGDTITIMLRSDKEENSLKGENIALDVLYEDEHLIVINKKHDMVVHPAAGHQSGTIVNALLGRGNFYAPDISFTEGRPGIVHRLDKDTTGCLVVAKHAVCMSRLGKLFAERKVKKTYAALVCNWPKLLKEEVKTLIGRHPVNRKKMAIVDRNGKEAITEYELLETGKINDHPFSLLKVRIKTGRTHQIRVHMASKHLPVLGDQVYGGHQKISMPHQMLHAWRLEFTHPMTGHLMRFRADFPAIFQNTLDSFAEREIYNTYFDGEKEIAPEIPEEDLTIPEDFYGDDDNFYYIEEE